MALLLELVGCNGNVANLGGGQGDSGPGREVGDGGATNIASQVQETPTNLVSDGTSLFWTSSFGSGSGISSMPVRGGPITTVVATQAGLLAVDNVNVYFLEDAGGIYRAPKGGGGSPTLVSEAGAMIRSVTVLATSAYWMESSGGFNGGTVTVKSSPLQGGAVSTIGEFTTFGLLPGAAIGVTSTTVFVSGLAPQLSSFPISSGVPDGGVPAQVPGTALMCQQLVSNTDAVYCDTGSSINRVASDGTQTALGMAIDQGLFGAAVTFDDQYVYWVDTTTVGTIMRVPKTGGTPTVIAHDTSPVAIAVDANAVYWSDMGGSIMRLPK
jgi:hypothetical protein